MPHEAGRAAPRPHPAVVVGIAVLALVLAVLAGGATGDWERAESGAEPPETVSVSPSPVEPPPAEEPTQEPIDDTPVAPAGTALLTWVLIVVAAVALVLLIIMIVRLLVGLSRRGDVGDATVGVAAGAADPEVELDPEEIQEGIARARGVLAQDLPPSDAIVAAWLALERAAAASGAARSPAQTPTEFTAVVLQRNPGERPAVEVLLRLYLRARFSRHPLREADAEAARDALTGIAAAWGSKVTS